jgi:hypothetical protein
LDDATTDPTATVAASYAVSQEYVFEFDEAAYSATKTVFAMRIEFDRDVSAPLKPFSLSASGV